MNLQNLGPPLEPADLKVFEHEIGGQLPDDFRNFLLTSNGGMTEPLLGLRWNGEVREVPCFGSLLPTPESGLRGGLRNLRELQVEGLLPIAGTINGDDICMAFKGNIGAIFLVIYRHDNDVPVGATVMPLAASFSELVANLVVIPTIYCPIVELGQKGTPEDLEAYLAAGNSLDAVGKNQHSILCEAIKYDNMPMFKACIEHGASLSQSIVIATFNRRPDLIQILHDAGADVNELDEYGGRPLGYVVGTALPGAEGALNRELHDLLISLGAVD